MKVGIFPNEELALQSLKSGLFDVGLVTGFENCCLTEILVPSGPYSDTFEYRYDTYVPNLLPIPYSAFERSKTLMEVQDEISRDIPEATFIDQRAVA